MSSNPIRCFHLNSSYKTAVNTLFSNEDLNNDFHTCALDFLELSTLNNLSDLYI